MRKKRVVAFVPIKLNSQRLPRKNLLPLGDKPLCRYIFDSLLRCEGIDAVYVYCSDTAIVNHIPESVCLKRRSASLDSDETKGIEIYSSFAAEVDADIYVLAHATSPFIKPQTISDALEKVLLGEYDSSFSVKEVQTFCWYNNKPLNYLLDDVVRTQDIQPVYLETSGFYIFEKGVLTNLGRRIGQAPYMCIVSGAESVDIDTREDYELALALLERKADEVNNDSCLC